MEKLLLSEIGCVEEVLLRKCLLVGSLGKSDRHLKFIVEVVGLLMEGTGNRSVERLFGDLVVYVLYEALGEVLLRFGHVG